MMVSLARSMPIVWNKPLPLAFILYHEIDQSVPIIRMRRARSWLQLCMKCWSFGCGWFHYEGDGCVVAGWRRNNAPLRKSERFPEEGWGFLDAEDFESEEVPSRCERVLMVAVASDDEEGFGCRLRDACGLASRLRSEASHVVGMATTSQAAECAVVACPGVLHGWHGFVDSHLANVGRWIARRTRSTPGYG